MRDQGRLCVLNIDGLRSRILEEIMGLVTPSTRVQKICTMTLGSLWEGLKKDKAEFVAKSPNCK